MASSRSFSRVSPVFAFASAVLLTACGGGGGGGGGSSQPAEATATLHRDNALQFAESLDSLANLGQSFADIYGPTAVSESEIYPLATGNSALSGYRRLAGTADAPVDTGPRAAATTQCSVSGSASDSVSGSEASGRITLVTTFNNCVEEGVTFSGKLTFTYSQFSQPQLPRSSVVTLDNYRISFAEGGYIGIQGRAEMLVDPSYSNKSLRLNLALVASAQDGSQQLVTEDLIFTLPLYEFANSSSLGYRYLAASGRFEDSHFGDVILSQTEDQQGLYLTGRSNTRVRLAQAQVNGALVRDVQVDEDGDGLFDVETQLPWGAGYPE